MEKLCSKCNEQKSIDKFHNLSTGKLGKHSHCKKCRSEYQKSLLYEKPINGKLKCSKCHIIKTIDCYYKDRSSSTGVQSYCIMCLKEKIYESQSKLNGYIKKQIKILEIGKILAIEDIINIYELQNRKCYLTDELLTYYFGPKLTDNNYETKYNISIIKKDKDKDFSKSNIVLVGNCIKKMVGNLNLEDFKNICKLIVKKTNNS